MRVLPGFGWRWMMLLAVVVAGLSSTPACLGQPAAPTAPEGATPGAASRLSREEETGRLEFERYCAFCHGQGGDGFGINAPNLPVALPDLTNRALQASRTDEELFEIVARGRRTVEWSPHVAPWGRKLRVREIEALVAYIRTLTAFRAAAALAPQEVRTPGAR